MLMNNIKVNECPKSLMLDPTEEDHAVIVRHGDDNTTIIPLCPLYLFRGLPRRRHMTLGLSVLNLRSSHPSGTLLSQILRGWKAYFLLMKDV
jgi:hypothetical protein